MNASLDGKITLTKREKEMLAKLPVLAAQVALHRPEATEGAAAISNGCKIVVAALLKAETNATT